MGDHIVVDSGQQGWICQRRRCGTATDKMYNNGDGEINCNDCNGLSKYRQGTTANLKDYRRYKIMGVADKISGEYIGINAQCWRCETTGIDTEVEDMWGGKRRDVGRQRLRNGLEERRQTRQILTGNDYQPEGVLSLP